jgi:MFS family permease
MSPAAWRLTLAAALLMALVSGSRAAFGLFVSPLNTASGIGLASLSFALALGQLAIGFTQPAVGALSDRFGAARVIVIGATLLAITTVLPAAWPLSAVALPALVASAVAGSAVASNGLLLGEVNSGVPAARTGLAVALVGAGASVGQLLLGPATQRAIAHQGWIRALAATALLCLLALLLASTGELSGAHTIARPMPVLPLVSSTTVRPGASRPRAWASSITASAIRSFTEPSGLKASSLAYRSA